MITSATLLVVSFFAAVLSCIVSVVKLIDRKRHAAKATPLLSSHVLGDPNYGERPAPCMSAKPTDLTLALPSAMGIMRTGDLFLFSGRSVLSILIRVASWSPISHVGMIYRDTHGRIYVAEVVERLQVVWKKWRFGLSVDKGGFQLTPLAGYVKKYPGQCYFAPVANEYDKPSRFNRERAWDAIRESRTWTYGWCGIFFQLLTKTPFIRVVAYLATWHAIDVAKHGRPPFCSWAVTIWATRAGQDPTPNLAPQLTTPAECERSKLWPNKILITE